MAEIASWDDVFASVEEAKASPKAETGNSWDDVFATVSEVEAGFDPEYLKELKTAETVAQLGVSSAPLGAAEWATAAKIAPEHRRAVLERSAELYKERGPMKGAGVAKRTGVAIAQGGIDMAMPVAQFFAPEELQLTGEQEAFRQALLSTREGNDPSLSEGWIASTVQQAARMAPPMLMMGAGGRAAGAIGKSAGLGARGVAAAQATGVAASAYPMAQDQSYRSLIAEGIDPEIAAPISRVSGALEGIIETIVPDPFKVQAGVLKGTTRRVISQALGRFAIQAGRIGLEAGEEGGQAFTREAVAEIARAIDDEIPNQGLGPAFAAAAEDFVGSIGPLSVIMGPSMALGAAGTARNTAARPGQYQAAIERRDYEQYRRELAKAQPPVEPTSEPTPPETPAQQDSATAQQIAALEKPPGAHKWAEIVLGDRKRFKDAPDEATRTKQWEQSRGAVQPELPPGVADLFKQMKGDSPENKPDTENIVPVTPPGVTPPQYKNWHDFGTGEPEGPVPPPLPLRIADRLRGRKETPPLPPTSQPGAVPPPLPAKLPPGAPPLPSGKPPLPGTKPPLPQGATDGTQVQPNEEMQGQGRGQGKQKPRVQGEQEAGSQGGQEAQGDAGTEVRVGTPKSQATKFDIYSDSEWKATGKDGPVSENYRKSQKQFVSSTADYGIKQGRVVAFDKGDGSTELQFAAIAEELEQRGYESGPIQKSKSNGIDHIEFSVTKKSPVAPATEAAKPPVVPAPKQTHQTASGFLKEKFPNDPRIDDAVLKYGNEEVARHHGWKPPTVTPEEKREGSVARILYEARKENEGFDIPPMTLEDVEGEVGLLEEKLKRGKKLSKNDIATLRQRAGLAVSMYANEAIENDSEAFIGELRKQVDAIKAREAAKPPVTPAPKQTEATTAPTEPAKEPQKPVVKTDWKLNDRVLIPEGAAGYPKAPKGLGTIIAGVMSSDSVTVEFDGGGRMRMKKADLQLIPDEKFKVGDKVHVPWAKGVDDAPATIVKVLPDGRYEVTFASGRGGPQRGDQMIKLESSTSGSSEGKAGSPTVSPDAPAKPETSKGKAAGENQSSEARAEVPFAETFDDIAKLPKYAVYQRDWRGGRKFMVRSEGERGGGDGIFDTEQEAREYADTERTRENQRVESEQRRTASEAEAQRKEKEYVESFKGFDSDSPMKFGKSRKVLEKRYNDSGTPRSRKEIIEDRIANGWTIKDDELQSPDGDKALTKDDLTSTGWRYAEHLLKGDEKPSPENRRGPKDQPGAKQRVYREMAADELDSIINPNTSSGETFGGTKRFWSDNPDLAIGQGTNKGFVVELDPSGLSLKEHAKPGTAVPGVGKEFTTSHRADEFRPGVRSVTVKPGANSPSAIRVKRFLEGEVKAGKWSKSKAEGSGVVYSPVPAEDVGKRESSPIGEKPEVGGKAPKPKPPAGYKPLAEFTPMVSVISSPDMEMRDNLDEMKRLKLQKGDAVGYRVYPKRGSTKGGYWQYGTVKDEPAGSHATIQLADGTSEMVGGSRLHKLEPETESHPEPVGETQTKSSITDGTQSELDDAGSEADFDAEMEKLMAGLAEPESGLTKPSAEKRPARKPRSVKKQPTKTQAEKAADDRASAAAKKEEAKRKMREAFNEIQTKPTSGFDVGIGAKVAQATKLYIEAGALDFRAFIRELVADFGKVWVEEKAPYFESAWRTANKLKWVNSPAGKVADVLKEVQDETAQGESGADGNTAVGDGTGESQGDAAATDTAVDEKRDAEKDTGQPSDSVLPDGAETAQDDGRGGGTGSGTDGNTNADQSEQGPAGATDTGAGSTDGSMGERVAVNHVIGQDDDLAVSSLTESLARNIKALNILKVLEKDGRFPDAAERKALAQYTGWGGLSQALDSIKGERMLSEDWRRDEAWEKKWGKAYRKLKDLLTKEEFQAAQDSTENAHYTSKPIIQAIWKIAERLGYNGGRVLELGAGIGHFAGLTPARVRGATQFTMVERDSVSSRIVKMLYPGHEVVAGDMEEFKAVPGSVTMGLGNVPFAGGTVGDSVRRYNEPLNLHNYSIARHLDAVAPGGIVVAVSSHSTLDANIKQRKFLATKGELIGAIRLPNNAFAENAKTEVVTDILIFRRPRQGDGTLGVRFDQNADVTVKNKDGEEVSRAINKYFLDNPEMVLGKHSAKGSMYGPDEYTVESTPGDLQAKLDAAIDKLPRDLLGNIDVAEKVVASDESVPFGRLEIQSGRVVMGFGDKFVPIAGKKFAGFPVHLTGKTGVSRAKDYIALRDVLADVRKTMLDEDATDEDVKRTQRKLSASYDKYVKAYGPLNSAKTNIFKRDPDYYRVLALENERAEYNPETKKIEVTYTKAAIFTNRVLGPQKEPDRADSPSDAMSISIAWRGAIDSMFIGKLLGVSPQEADGKLLEEGLAFRNPSTTELELSELYLSGNVRSKLEQAKISAEEDPQYGRNVEALTKVLPKPVTLKKDTVRLGATWIPEQVIDAFATQEFGTDVRVSYNANTDAWTVGRVYGISETAKSKYETGRIDPDDLLAEVLNLRSIKIYDQVETGEVTASGKPKTTQTLNEKETQAAKHRASVLRAEFEKWVLGNPEVTQVLAKLYNDKYNNFVRTKYNGEFLVLPGANPEVILRPYQKDAIWRIINRGTSLLAHAVGAGKTYTMIGAAMEMRRLGLARRPVIVVQNATLGQFATSFQKMYPNANVLVADKNDLGKGKRQLFLNKVSTGNWDAVVIAQSTFDNMASEPDVERAFIQDQLDLLEEAIREEGGEGARTPTVKQLVRTKKSLKTRFDKLMGSRAKKEDNVTFEDLGADALFLDEAHAYKKPTFTTKLSQLVGLNVEASARSLATTIKVRSVQAAHNGRNVILATGTPVTNTLGEAWHMVNYVSPATNAEFSSRTFDQFIGNFAQVEPTLTMNAGGQYVYKDAIVKFRNGHQLVEYINDSWDIITPDAMRAYMVSSKKGFPELRGGQPSAITVERTPGVAVFMDFISQVYTRYKGLTAKERRELSFIPALAYGASKAATLDIRLVVPNAAEEKNSKLQKAAEEIKRIYDESADVKGAQLFFSDMKNPFSMTRLRQFMGGEAIDAFAEDSNTDSTEDAAEPVEENESGSFLYQELKKKLLGMGIPKEQIAFISDAKTDKQRLALFERVKTGDIRVLIGSTAKMGIGVNVQDKLVALHHFDTPWLPADLEQREGRILRFGNENETVDILRYAMKKTLDGAIYMATARKQKFIWQVLNGQLDGDSFEDPSSAAMLSIEEQLAAIQDDPVFFEKIEIQNRLREMELERQSFYDAQQRLAGSLSHEKFWLNKEETGTLPQWQRRLEKVKKLQDIKDDGGLEKFVMTFGNQTFDDPKKAAEFIKSKVDAISKYVIENHEKSQSFDKAGGLLSLGKNQKVEFEIGPAKVVIGAEPRGAFVQNAKGETVTEFSARVKSLAYLQEPGGRHEFYDGTATTPATFFDKMQSLPEVAQTEVNQSEARVSRYQAKIAEIEGLMGKQWEDQAEYDAKKERLAEIEGQMLASKGNLSAPEPEADSEQDGSEGGGIAQMKAVPTRQSRTQRLKGESEAAGIAAADIQKTAERLFDVAIRQGGFNQKAAGIYKWITNRNSPPSPEVIRTAEDHYANLAVIAHEIAHHIDEKTKAVRSMPKDVKREVSDLDYEPEKGRAFEGWAEFLRRYMTEPPIDVAGNMLPNPGIDAPKTLAWFEGTFLQANPEVAKAIAEFRKYAQQFAQQSVFQRVGTLIADRKPHDLSFKERWLAKSKRKLHRLKTMFVDKFHTLEWIQDEAKRRGHKGKVGIYDMTMAYFMSSTSHATIAFEEGVRNLQTGKPIGTTTLWGLREHLQSDGEYQDATLYALARHTVFMDAKKPGYNTGMDIQDAKAWMAEVESNGQTARFEAFAEDLATFNNDLIEMLVQAGALAPSDAATMLDYYGGKNYFPLHRVKDVDNSMFSGAGAGFVNLGKAVKKRSRRGSGRQIIDPIDATVAQAIRFYGRAIQARQQHVLAATLDPLRGGVGGMGGLMDRVDPKRIVHRGTIKEILGTLVEEGVIEADDAKAMRIAAAILDGDGPLSQDSLEWFAERHGIEELDDELAFTEAAETEPNALAFISLWRPDYTPNAAKRTVRIYDEHGKPLMYELDPDLYATATGMEDIQFNGFMATLREASRYFKSGAVGLSTGFGTANLLRDYWEFQGKARHTKGLNSLGKPPEMLGRYVAAKVKQAFGGSVSDNALIRLYEETGGKVYSVVGHDVHGRKMYRRRRLGKTTMSKMGIALKRPGDTAQRGLQAVQELIAISDAPPRLADAEAAIKEEGYERRLDKWYDLNADELVDHLPEHVRIKAAVAMAEATINFKRIGSKGQYLEAFMPFFNATVQASYRQYKQLNSLKSLGKKDAEGMQAKRYLVYLSALASTGILYWLLRHDDDDWREQDSYLRDGYWTWGANGKTYLRVPKPRDTAVVTNVVENMLDGWYRDDARSIRDLLLRDLGGRMPTGGGLARGALETYIADYDYFREQDLTPYNMQKMPKELQVTPYTSRVSDTIGKVTGKYLGTSPIQVEHLLNSASGGLYHRMTDLYEAVGEGRIGPEHIPFVRGLFIDRHQARSVNDFYDKLDDTDSAAYLEKDAGEVSDATTGKLAVMEGHAELMTKLRNMEGRNGKRREYEYQPYIVGLARHSLGYGELANNPNPLVAKDVPQPIADAMQDYKGRAVVLASESLKKRDDYKDEEAYESQRKTLVRGKAKLKSLGLTLDEAKETLKAYLKTQHGSAYEDGKLKASVKKRFRELEAIFEESNQ